MPISSAVREKLPYWAASTKVLRALVDGITDSRSSTSLGTRFSSPGARDRPTMTESHDGTTVAALSTKAGRRTIGPAVFRKQHRLDAQRYEMGAAGRRHEEDDD